MPYHRPTVLHALFTYWRNRPAREAAEKARLNRVRERNAAELRSHGFSCSKADQPPAR